jgi:hypothetical protein
MINVARGLFNLSLARRGKAESDLKLRERERETSPHTHPRPSAANFGCLFSGQIAYAPLFRPVLMYVTRKSTTVGRFFKY